MQQSLNRVALLCSAAMASLLFGCGVEQEEAGVPPDTGAAASAQVQAAGGPPGQIVGELQMLVVDDFEGRRSWLELQVREEATGELFELHGFDEGRLPEGLRHGAKVRVHGHVENRSVMLDVRGEARSRSGIELLSAPAAAAVTGTRDTLVIVANYTDASVTCSTTDIEATMFGATDSTDAIFRDTSLGALRFTGDVVGPYQIPVSSTDRCDPFRWATKADAEAARQGYDASTYDNVVYVFPPAANCSFVGIAQMYGSKSISIDCGYRDVYAHELGHNLGLQHAWRNTSEYADTSDMMGYAVGYLRGLNAPHKLEMGWIDQGQVREVLPGDVVDIAPLEPDHLSTSGLPQILKIAKPDTAEHYYLSYRQPLGADVALPTGWTSGLHVHQWPGFGKTVLTKTLSDTGNFFGDSLNGIAFRQVYRDASMVTVQVEAFVDITAPTVPTNLRATIVQDGRKYNVRLLWGSSTDDAGVTGYDVLEDGDVVGTATSIVYWEYGVRRGQTFTYSVRARDAAGNVSAETAPLTVTIQ